MRAGKLYKKYIIAFMIVFVFGILIIGNTVAEGPGGPLTIYGQVYNSDGKIPSEGDGAYAAVIIEHNGAKKTFADPDGVELINGSYWYAVTIPEGAWKKGDTYWIWIDGSDWGDENYTTRDHDDTGVNRWTIGVSGGNEELHVNTGDSNFKPILAIIFAIIIAVIAIIIGLLRPLRVPISGRPKQPADLVEGMLITGEAQIPEELPPEEVAAAPAAEEERTCETCGEKLEFIQEYNAWYCNTCKKYPDEDETPPPDEEDLPPPDDEDLPPPDDEEPKGDLKEETKEGSKEDEPPAPKEGGD
jgi:hypothetical protein